MDLLKFRWQHTSSLYRCVDIGIIINFSVAMIFYILQFIKVIDIGDSLLVVLLIALMIQSALIMVSEYNKGRIDQKYLNEMNEIRIKLKRKPIKDI
jgi:hypothetical protein